MGRSRNNRNRTKETYESRGTRSGPYGNEKLNKDFGEILFTNPSGIPLDLRGQIANTTDEFGSALASKCSNMVLPGIMSFSVVTGPGESYDGTSAVNIASRNVYTYMRNVKNGQFPFEHQDVTMFIMAMDSAFMLYAHLCRAYKTIRKYDGLNRYLPRTLLLAMGFEPDDLMHNIKNFKGVIDMFRYKLGTLYVPESFPIIKRHLDLYRGVFKDHTNTKCQLYLYKPRGFHVWEEIIDTSTDPATIEGKCKYAYWNYLPYMAGATGSDTPVNTQYWTLKDIEAVINYIYNSLMSSEDVASINGYLLSVYGESGLYTLAELGEDEILEFDESEDELHQIHNMTILPVLNSAYSQMNLLDITQDDNINNGWILWKPKTTTLGSNQDTNRWGYFTHRLMDTNKPSPSADDVASLARWMVVPEFGVDTTGTVKLHVSSEFIAAATVYYANPDSAAGFDSFNFNYVNNLTHAQLARISDFDYSPILLNYSQSVDASGHHVTNFGIFGDFDNFTVMSDETLWKLKESDIMHLWNITSK